MFELIHNINELGTFSIDSFWFPLLIWTACSLLAFLFLKLKKNLNPLFQYHLRAAAIISLPLGIVVSFLLKLIPELFSTSEFESAFFVVSNPIKIVTGDPSVSTEQAILWQEPSFFIGMLSFLIIIISAVMLLRFAASYLELRKLYKNLELTALDVNHSELKEQNIQLAFHSHPLVPFTFGWKNPVIVLPELIRKDEEKLQMALQHELTHIKRGDYLLQLALSIVESLFWFHPLIHFGTKEIDTFREISCDQEVLSTSDFSVKSYANLLYELMPLNNGVDRLSVSMAVQNSTLKQRIKTMKYHKLYKTSFKQSIFFLLLMMIGITLPIACSDLRGTEAISNAELEKTEIQIQNPSVTINGINIDTKNAIDLKVGGLGAARILIPEYGMFKVAPREFENGIQAGSIEGNMLSFEFNSLNVKLISSSEIMPGISSTPVWVSHISNIKIPAFMLFPMENALAEMPPPPPASNNTGAFDKDLGDYFVVVEEMPEPIGGIAAIQSKIEYPEMAQRAGVEGRVTVQFIVNETGDVENAKVVRGIGAGCDEEALRVVEQAKFKPGIQRGKAARVQFALSINFRLSDSDFQSVPPSPPTEKS